MAEASTSDTNASTANVLALLTRKPLLVDNRTTTASLGFSYSYAVPGFTAGITHELVAARVDENMSGLEQDALLLRSSLLLVKLVAPLWQARLRGDLQATSEDELPGVLEYQIGGARSVRAYQPGVAAGDRGLSVSAELGRTFQLGPASLEPFLFADHAQSSSLGDTVSLQAVGVGLNLSYRGRLSFRAHYAHGVGHHGLPDGEDRAFASLTVRY